MDALKVAVSERTDLETLVSLALLHLAGVAMEEQVVKSTRGMGGDVVPFVVTDTAQKPLAFISELLRALDKPMPISEVGQTALKAILGQERATRRHSLAALAFTTVLARRIPSLVKGGERHQAVGLVQEAVRALALSIQALDSRVKGEEPKEAIHGTEMGPKLLNRQAELLAKVGGSPEVMFGTLMQLVVDCFHLGYVATYGEAYVQQFTDVWFRQFDGLLALDRRDEAKDRKVPAPDVVLVKFYGVPELPDEVARQSAEAHERRQAAIAEKAAARPEVAPVRKGVVDTGTCVIRVEPEQVRGGPSEQMKRGRREEPVYCEVVSVRKLTDDLKAAGYKAVYAYEYVQPKGAQKRVLVIVYKRGEESTPEALTALRHPVVREPRLHDWAGCAVWVNPGQRDGVVATVNMDVAGRSDGKPTHLRFSPTQGRDGGFFLEAEVEPQE